MSTVSGVNRFSRRRRRPRLAAAALATAAFGAGGLLVGCDQLSEETRAAGADLLCSQIEVEPSDIEQNPETARLVALVIRDLAPEKHIRDLADRVADDPSLLDPRTQLARWVRDECTRTIGGSAYGGADSDEGWNGARGDGDEGWDGEREDNERGDNGRGDDERGDDERGDGDREDGEDGE